MQYLNIFLREYLTAESGRLIQLHKITNNAKIEEILKITTDFFCHLDASQCQNLNERGNFLKLRYAKYFQWRENLSEQLPHK